MHIEENIEEYAATNVYVNISDGFESSFLPHYSVHRFSLVSFYIV